MGRIILAFAVAPLVVPVAFAPLMLARQASRDQWILAPIATALAYGVILIGGIPVVLLYRAMGWSRAWHYALGGFVLGVVAFYGFATDSLGAFAVFGGLGALTAIAFWGIGVRGNARLAGPRTPGARLGFPSPLRSPGELREAARRAGDRVRPVMARARERAWATAGAARRWFAEWRRPAQTPSGLRRPVAGTLAVSIPLLTTVGTFPWLWPGIARAVERLYTLGMILVLAYVGFVIALSGMTVVIALVAVVLRERYRFWLATAAIALAALGLVIMRGQV
jgi:hypothetical protein